MPFWAATGPLGSFVIHFTKGPERDFGHYGRGYALAASALAKSFVERGHADYEAYPIVFLYRHALELYLKCLVVKGVHLAGVTGQEALEKITLDHDLSRLLRAADSVLRQSFPEDSGLNEILANLAEVVEDIVELDRSSYIFRYPVDKSWERPVADPLCGSVAAIASTMDPLLESLDSIETGLDVETDLAEEALSSYLNDLESEVE